MRLSPYHSLRPLFASVSMLGAALAAGCGPTCGKPWYPDLDGDGFGDRTAPTEACERPALSVDDPTDCDDGDPNVHPGATEACNGVDDDCDGVVDPDAGSFFVDSDGDGYGNTDVAVSSCGAPVGFAARPGDCDDGDAGIHPGDVPEQCDGQDQDCDGIVDEGAPGVITYFPDEDLDGYGGAAGASTLCARPAGWITRGGDCDDDNSAVSPGLTEVCNGFDDNCNVLVDDDDPSLSDPFDLVGYAVDADLDGYGSETQPAIVLCALPAPTPGLSYTFDDCDDTDGGVHPGAGEVCGGGDEDCDGLVDQEDSGIDPSTLENGWADDDADGLGDPLRPLAVCALGQAAANDLDCDDDDAAVGVDWWLDDADGDGAGAGIPEVGDDCAPPAAGMVNVDGPRDCDDDDPAVREGVADPCGDGVDQDCSGLDPVCAPPIDQIRALDDVGRGSYAAGSPISAVWAGFDLDGDGFGDVVSGIPGASTVAIGSGPGPETVGPWAPSRELVGEPGGSFGAAVLGIPDASGDGAPELVVL
ncbi:MAG: putative metal-binding motif-containing protein, partial [Myxococcota bacterium]